jgi:hypothetical protein
VLQSDGNLTAVLYFAVAGPAELTATRVGEALGTSFELNDVEPTLGRLTFSGRVFGMGLSLTSLDDWPEGTTYRLTAVAEGPALDEGAGWLDVEGHLRRLVQAIEPAAVWGLEELREEYRLRNPGGPPGTAADAGE